ncbi:VOC family protein [Terrabacter sp. NPDC000476]|uniref:VOC family protein n=1 Tax=Terrabacter sp. NPDC000476 TaxID=3154258 RepID=UPI00333114C1
MPVVDGPLERGTPCWADLLVDDLPRARDFYGSLLGWSFDDARTEGAPVVARLGGRPVAAVLAKDPGDPGQRTAWTVHLATDDVDAAAARATDAGGVLFLGPADVPGIGRLCVGADPAGAAYGLLQVPAPADGAERTADAADHADSDPADAPRLPEPGTLCWAESMSRDYAASLDFYAAVLGYRWREIGSGGFRYSAATTTRDASEDGTDSAGDGPAVAGVGAIPTEAPADVPSHWMAYFAVADCDAAVARVVALGGSLVREPFDSPYGRIALVAGPQGETFSVLQAGGGGKADPAQYS